MTFATRQVRKAKIGITLGDINGVGPEVVLKSISDTRVLKYMDPVLIGPRAAIDHFAAKLALNSVKFVSWEPGAHMGNDEVGLIDTAGHERVEVREGVISSVAGRFAMEAVEVAVDYCANNQLDAMVTAPISKEAISRAGFDVPGHTEFIAERLRARRFTMMMVAQNLRVGLVTAHVPLAKVPERVTRDAILEKLRIINESLQNDFGIDQPTIGVLGINPHAGDGGVIGLEEGRVITPAIKAACEAGILAFGPFAADGFFASRSFQKYDAVLAMYHDQGLVPFKTLSFNSGVNFTAGLPIVRTSPDHGTAFDIAGKGVASPESMRQAIYLALDLARSRLARHEPA